MRNGTYRLLIGLLILTGLIGMTAVGISAETASGSAHQGAGTTITVTSTLDLANTFNWDNHTCTYTSGAIYFPDASDSTCTLRRAVLEASVRPDSDRPINIVFNIPTSDPNYDAALDLWEIQIDETYEWGLSRRFITDEGGNITIDGNTQPGGRSGAPKIMINTNRDNLATGGRTFEVRVSDNTIRNLGFHGGGAIYLYEANNLVEYNWMGLSNDGSALKLATTASTQGMRALARGGIIMPVGDSDNNIIRFNRIIGAHERAIRVTSGGSGNVIRHNAIGMNADGEVPLGARSTIDCTRLPDYDSDLWYGGRGIQVTGSDNTVRNNILAGLHVVHESDGPDGTVTPPISMEIYGERNQVRNNIVGIDQSDNRVGVCGQGLLFGGTESEATGNRFVFTRNGFDPGDIGQEPDSVIITQSFTGRGTGEPPRWMKVWNNYISGDDNAEANYHSYRFGNPGVNEDLRKHIPAKITSISGTSVSGTNGDKQFGIDPETDCGSCTVFIYRDDLDDRIEAFELIGTGTFAANGLTWTGTLSRTLAAGEGLRTQNMTTNDSTIISDAVPPVEYYGANTTSRLSDDVYQAGAVTLEVSLLEGKTSAETTINIILLATIGLMLLSRTIYQRQK